MIVENRPGADGAIAAKAVASAAPDGYWLLPSTGSHMSVNPLVQRNLPYDPLRDFEPIGMFARVPMVLVVNPAVPAATVRELVAYAKANPDALNYGSGGSIFMLATEVLRKLTGMPMRHIPYTSVPPAVTGILAGDVQLGIVNLAPSLGHIRAGKLRALAIMGPTPDPLLPDVPTIAEAGVRGFDVSIWLGMFAPHGTPPEIVARLAAALARAVESAPVRERMLAAGLVPVSSTPQALGDTVRRELKQFGVLVKDAGLAVN
jgi:tripartite-type tricarboxylate transporter receptor subunit TctC